VHQLGEASDVKYDGVWAKRIVDAKCRVALIPHPPHDGSCLAEPLHNLLVSDAGIENVWPLELAAPPIEDVVSELWHQAAEFTQRRLYDLRHEFLRHKQSHRPTVIHLAAPSWPANLSALTPANHRAGDDRQNGPTDGGYYQLAYDGDIVTAPPGGDQGLED
jgi:hypothetical protein